MATITVTPGHTYGTTDTVTSTNLNDLGSPTAALTAASIGTADIADDAITPALIADDAITTPAILDENVTTAKIADDNVTTAKIADSNVTFAKLTDVIDDDTMDAATDTTLATSESIKAYVDGTSSFTTEDGQSAGYQVFPSGLKMAWGSVTGAIGDTVSFPVGVAFTVAPTVTISYNTMNSFSYSAGCNNVTTTGFRNQGWTIAFKPRYLAIGI